jgi:hypothetical protein
MSVDGLRQESPPPAMNAWMGTPKSSHRSHICPPRPEEFHESKRAKNERPMNEKAKNEE